MAFIAVFCCFIVFEIPHVCYSILDVLSNDEVEESPRGFSEKVDD